MERLAGWCYDHRRSVVLLWIAGLISAVALGIAFGGKYATDFSVPEIESQKAYDLLREKFPEQAGDSAQIVVKAPGGVLANRAKIEQIYAAFDEVEHVAGVVSPFDDPSGRSISPDGTVALAEMNFDVKVGATTSASAIDVRARRRAWS